MSNKIINSRIQIKKDNSINWEVNNPVLLDGEIAIVKMTDSIKLKIGDGATNYIDLPFFLDDVLTEMENKIKSASTIPSGMIMIWSGSQSDIPNGWVLCNGQNNTPDLTDKFVIGAGSNYSIGNTGGEISHTHKYKVGSRPFYGTLSGEDSKGIMAYDYTTNSFKEGIKIASGEDTRVNDATVLSYNIAAPHFMGSEANVSTTSNMPPYYALCYIMKL